MLTLTPSPPKQTVCTDPPYFVEGMKELNRDVALLAAACADAICKSVQYYEGDAWAFGTLPQCETLAGVAEVRAKSLLVAPQTSGAMVDQVMTVLRSVESLRSVACACRQSVQLAFLLPHVDTEASSRVFPIIHLVGHAASDVGSDTVVALEADSRERVPAARRAALRYRAVEAARGEAQAFLQETELPETSRRMTRAALWCMILAGENMARIAARLAAG